MLELETPGGTKHIDLRRFSALDGWDIHTHFTRFADSKDMSLRRKYVFRVLGYTRVMVGKVEIPLSTGALVDNHLYNQENVGKVFESVLAFNGIRPRESAQLTDHRNAIANEIATSFLTECMGAMQQFVAFFVARSEAS